LIGDTSETIITVKNSFIEGNTVQTKRTIKNFLFVNLRRIFTFIVQHKHV